MRDSKKPVIMIFVPIFAALVKDFFFLSANFSFSFYFISALQSDNYNNEFYVLGYIYVLDPFRR